MRYIKKYEDNAQFTFIKKGSDNNFTFTAAEPYDYLVFQDGELYGVKDSNANTVFIGNAEDALNYALSSGKHIYAAGNFNISNITIPEGVVLDISAANINLSAITVNGTLKDGSTWYSNFNLMASKDPDAANPVASPPELKFIGKYFNGTDIVHYPLTFKPIVYEYGTYLQLLNQTNSLIFQFSIWGDLWLSGILLPLVDNKSTIGNSTYRFKDGYFAGIVYANSGIATQTFVDDYGGGFANFVPPTGEEGLIILAQDTNATTPGVRLYSYINGAWHYVDLT